MSRFELNLVELSAAESNNLQKSILELKLAAYRGRTGASKSARESISAIRLRYLREYSAQLFAYINFAEAICDFFDHGVEAGLTKLRRSRVLCAGCPEGDDLPPLVSAWLANSFRILGKWDQVSAEVFDVLKGLQIGGSIEAKGRLALVLADCFQEIEDYKNADLLYKTALNTESSPHINE